MSDARRARLVGLLGLSILGACTTGESQGPPLPPTSDPPSAATTAPASAATPTGSAIGPRSQTPAPSTPASVASWTAMREAPTPATEVAAAAHAGRAWVVGGYDATGEPLAMVQVYDPTSDTWAAGPPLPEALHHASLVSTGTRLYLIGGFLSSFADGTASRPSSSVWILNAREDGWTQGPALPQARGAGAGAWDGERLVYGGGVGPNGVTPDIFALEDGSWALAGSLSAARQHLAATSDDRGRVWFLGGRLITLADNTGAVDLLEATVTQPGGAITPRSGLGAFWHTGAGACAVGGETPTGTLPTVECADESGTVVVLPLLGVPRHGLGVVSLDGVVYALLGGAEPGLYVSATNEALSLDE